MLAVADERLSETEVKFSRDSACCVVLASDGYPQKYEKGFEITLRFGVAEADVYKRQRYTFSYTPIAGLGHFIHTYNCNGNPIPTFTGEPERVIVPDCIDAFAAEIWENLNEENKISLYVRYIDIETGAAESRMFNKNK